MTELKDFATSAVVLGRLNPLIFSPEWLHSNNVIGPEDAKAARERGGIEVIAPNIASVVLGSMKLIVEEGRFQLSVSDEPLVRAKDFTASCFRLLAHTPVFAVGLNFDAVITPSDLEKWHRFGDLIAPKAPWGDFTFDGRERAGGVRALIMERSRGFGGREGYIRLSVQVNEGRDLSANLQVNNHFAIGTGDKLGSGADVYKLLEDLWDEAYENSKKLLENVRAQADNA